MDTHKNAPLTPKVREAMVRSVIESGLNQAAAALQFNVSAKTVAKWVKRFRAGVDGVGRPLLAARFIAKPNPPATCTEARDVAPAAPHGPADRDPAQMRPNLGGGFRQAQACMTRLRTAASC